MNFQNTYTPIPLGLTIARSTHGHGIFATSDIKAGVFLGVTHIWEQNRRDWIRTPLGGFINHNEDPNCFISTNIHYHDGDQRELYAVRPISEGDEILIYYTMSQYE